MGRRRGHGPLRAAASAVCRQAIRGRGHGPPRADAGPSLTGVHRPPGEVLAPALLLTPDSPDKPQVIPRPAGARAGGPPPWAGLPAPRLRPSADRIVEAVEALAPMTPPSPAPSADLAPRPEPEQALSPDAVSALPPGSGPNPRAEPGRGWPTPTGPVSPSAVLVPLYERDGLPWLVLTRRASHLRNHAHEVAFPGGRREPADADLWATALREASEEIGLDPARVRPIGRLESFTTVTSRARVHPFVGLIDRLPPLTPDPAEVESILHIGVHQLLSPDVWREEIWPLGGAERPMAFFELDGDTVWGMTASVLRRFLTVITR